MLSAFRERAMCDTDGLCRFYNPYKKLEIYLESDILRFYGSRKNQFTQFTKRDSICLQIKPSEWISLKDLVSPAHGIFLANNR